MRAPGEERRRSTDPNHQIKGVSARASIALCIQDFFRCRVKASGAAEWGPAITFSWHFDREQLFRRCVLSGSTFFVPRKDAAKNVLLQADRRPGGIDGWIN
jgi:hypothetical protein